MNLRTPTRPVAHWYSIVVLLLLLTSLAAVPATRAAGDWYVATAGADGNDCQTATTACRTIAGALGKSNPGDTINIAGGTYAERLTVNKDVSLVGAGATTTIIDGGAGGGVFTIFTAQVQIANVTIRNGRSVGSGGGITNFGTLTLTDSSVSENVTLLGEGFQGFGGGIANFGTLALTNTAVLSNTGVFGGGIYTRGSFSAINSTISGNRAQNDGGGIANVLLGRASLSFATVAGNTTDSDGNGIGDGGGLFNATTSTFGIDSSLLGGNVDTGGQAPDCAGTYDSAGHNIIQNPAGCTLGGAETHAEILGQDPLIGPLADHGGPTLTHALLADSPAIDHSDNPTCPATDQRGIVRPQGLDCDSGAFEAEPQIVSAIWYVTPFGSDSADCQSPATACQTIGAAVGKAAPGGTIAVAAGTYPEQLTFRSDLSIQGAGADATMIDGGGSGGVITIFGSTTSINLANLSIQNGASIGSGGGITNFGRLTLTSSRLRDNRALIGEGFQGFGGAIANFGTLALSDTDVLSNTAFFGGGIYNSGTLTATNSTIGDNIALLSQSLQGGLGGGIANFGTLTLQRSTIARNSARTCDNQAADLSRSLPGIGGGIANFGTLAIRESSILSNTASFGAGLTNLGTLTAINSTFSGNQAHVDGGGIANSRIGTVSLNNVTIAGNTADSDANGSGMGGGISNEISGTVGLQNTLLADNADRSEQAPDCSGALNSAGHNLVQNLEGCALNDTQDSDILNQAADLGPLGDNGGPTLTNALLAASPAIDAGSPTTCPATDQRGMPRPQGAACDIGAYEYKPVGPLALSFRSYLSLVRL
jgi:hypothetical protein